MVHARNDRLLRSDTGFFPDTKGCTERFQLESGIRLVVYGLRLSVNDVNFMFPPAVYVIG